MAVDLAEVLSLPIDEKLRLVEAVWDSIAADSASVPVPSSHKAELDRRLDAFEKDGQLGRPAADVIAELKANA